MGREVQDITGKQASQDQKDCSSLLLLIHGLGANRALMWPLARRLRRKGFVVINWGYASLIGSIEGHARKLARQLLIYERDPKITEIRIVAHSMGCIVTRAALTRAESSKLRRAVFLSPPNRGSRVARFFAPLFGWIVPAIRDLSSAPKSYVNRLPDSMPCPTGIIAARWDLLVGLDQTPLDTQVERRVVKTTHLGLLFHRSVAEQIESFLTTGSFAQATTNDSHRDPETSQSQNRQT